MINSRLAPGPAQPEPDIGLGHGRRVVDGGLSLTNWFESPVLDDP
jgi:hypothetical protein